MDELTLSGVVAIILAVAGAVTTVCVAGEKIAGIINLLKAPNEAQDQRLTALEKDVKKVFTYLDNDKKSIDRLAAGNRVTQQALLALLAHGIDGNNIEQMQNAEKALENHLIYQN